MSSNTTPGSNSAIGRTSEYASPDEFAGLTGLSMATVRRYLRDGRLPKVQPGGKRCRVMIPRDALEEFLPSSYASGESTDVPMADNTAVSSPPTTSTPRDHGPVPRWMERR